MPLPGVPRLTSCVIQVHVLARFPQIDQVLIAPVSRIDRQRVTALVLPIGLEQATGQGSVIVQATDLE